MITFESAINRLAERVSDHREESRNISLQRRNQVVDMYGMEFTRQGDGTNAPASFYISISPDLIYFERFEFKVIIGGFQMPFMGINVDGVIETSYSSVTIHEQELQVQSTPLTTNENTANITINPTPLTITNNAVNPASHNHEMTQTNHNHTIPPHTHAITPNGHRHETAPHRHSIVAGISEVRMPPRPENQFSIWIWVEDIPEREEISDLIERRVSRPGERPQLRINMTPYFRAIFPSGSGMQWMNGTGIFPSAGLKNFDLLEAVAYMDADLRGRVLKPGYKRIDIVGNGLFTATLVNYLKYSHVNR